MFSLLAKGYMMTKINPRRNTLLRVGAYKESDQDFVANNLAACVEFLERESRTPTGPSQAMLVNGARSIGNSMNDLNHMVRAHKCYEAMRQTANGHIEPKPTQE